MIKKIISVSLLIFGVFSSYAADDLEVLEELVKKISPRQALKLTRSKNSKVADIATLFYCQQDSLSKALEVSAKGALIPEKAGKFRSLRQEKIESTYETLNITSGDFIKNRLYSHYSLADSLRQSGLQNIALSILEPLAAQKEHIPARIVGAEGITRILIEQYEFEKARKTLDFALLICKKINKDIKSGDYQQLKLIKPEFHIIAVWQKKLQELDRLLKIQEEINKYGVDWVLYRNAEAARLKGNYIQAFVIFKEITHYFPKTVYSEYSHFRSLEMLLSNQVQVRVNKSFSPNYPVASKDLIKGGNAYLALSEDRQRRLKDFADFRVRDTPGKLITNFLQSNKYGLYRGEMLLVLILHELKKGDAKSATKNISNMESWLKNVRGFDEAVQNVKLPVKVQQVSKPPQASISFDGWGNQKELEIKPGIVFNRKTSPWYLDHLWTRLLGKKGVVLFTEKNNDAAVQAFSELFKHNPQWKTMQKEGDFSTPRRLIASARAGYFQASKEQLKYFNNKQAYVMLILAEYFFFSRQWDRAINQYKSIMKLGSLNKEAQAYLHMGIARTTDMKHGNAGSPASTFDLYQKAIKREFRYTLAYKNALFCAANSSTQLSIEYKKKGIVYLDELIKISSRSELHEKAMMTKVTLFSSLLPGKSQIWDKNKAHIAAAAFKKEYPDSIYKSMLEFILSDKLMQQEK